MLAVLMYHRVIKTAFSSAPEAFIAHLSELAHRYPIVIPGEKLEKNRINICLTFDDAYYDFYALVFPLLQKLGIRALLAIPSGLVLESSNVSEETRLNVPYKDALNLAHSHATLCSWQEIRQMVNTNLVIPAAHGLTHQNLIHVDNLDEEIITAKNLLQEKTNFKIDTYVYPYGRMTRAINHHVNQHYRYAMRIGSALNRNWKNTHNVIYRINAEEFWPQKKPLFTFPHQLSMSLRYISNTCRFK